MENLSGESFEEFSKKIETAFSIYHKISKEVLDNFSQLLWMNPEKALDQLISIYDNSLDKVYSDENGKNNRCFVEMICGGPHEAIPSAVYNSVGTIYPFLDRKIKDNALKKILSILDGIRYDYVQFSHISYIKEPTLTSDITISRPLYWPGMGEGENLIKKYNNLFCDFKSEGIDKNGIFNQEIVDSDFIVAYSFLRNDFCNWGEEYVKIANTKFLERTINGIIGMRFAKYFRLKSLSEEEKEVINHEAQDPNFYSKNEEKLNEILEKRISDEETRLKELLPKSLHGKIEEKILQKDWVDPFLFLDHKSYFLKSNIERCING
jgi:hypothetical protein